jgi:DNA-binding transcriptional ArsR family regulator
LTGETQLRARLTRIKILRAIAERNGSAGFSDIRNATGLSTGSIYYHLERMEDYVTKDSKQYKITEEGLELQPRPLSQLIRDYSIPSLIIITSLFFVSLGFYLYDNIISSSIVIENKLMTNSAIISSSSISILLIASFSIIWKRQRLTTGYTRMMILL